MTKEPVKNNEDILRNEVIKFSSNKEYISYWLASYAKKYNLSKEKMIEMLKCEQKGYYETALYKIPLVENGTYLPKTTINCICICTGVNYEILHSMLTDVLKQP